MVVTAGSRIGPFEVLAPVGAGGMGEVWRARDPRIGRDVAIKVLPTEFARDSERLRRFEQEARAAGQLNHPNILAVHDIGTHEGAPYIVMEMLEGETLGERLRGGGLTIRKAIEIGVQITHGLHAAHEKGIVHRDLKPANVILTRDGQVKILDFGIAKVSQFEGRTEPDASTLNMPSPTAEGVVLGSMGYTAPEQLRGESVDRRSDIFAFGCVLFEMLSGRSPFLKRTGVDTVTAILNEDPPPLTASGRVVAPALQEIVNRCLEKNPHDRFSSAHDLSLALRAVSGSGEVPDATPAYSGMGRSTRGRFAAVAVALVLVSAAAGISLWKGRGAARSESGGDSATTNATSNPKPETASVATAESQNRTIAVIPFTNPSSATEQVSDGIAERLIDELSVTPALRVTARSSSFRYRPAPADVRTVGRELGVATVITGNLVENEGKYRLRLELIDTRDGSQLWGREYVYPTSDVEDLYRRVVAEVALRLGVTKADDSRTPKWSPAHDLYLRGRFLWSLRGRQENYLRAIECFERAIEIDPEFALAYAGLANAYGTMVGGGLIPGQEAALERKAEEAAEKAIALDPTVAEAWASLAAGKTSYHRDFEGAERDFRRAIELNPNNASTRQWYSSHLRHLGRSEEARREVDLAWQLDPYSRTVNSFLCWNRWTDRRYQEALDVANRAYRADPSLWLHACVERTQVLLGDYPAAIEARRRANARDGEALADAFKKSGVEGYWRTWMNLTPKHLHYALAVGHAFLNERDEAFEQLERSFELRQSDINAVYVDPSLDNLRSDPRFDDLARRIGLPQVMGGTPAK